MMQTTQTGMGSRDKSHTPAPEAVAAASPAGADPPSAGPNAGQSESRAPGVAIIGT